MRLSRQRRNDLLYVSARALWTLVPFTPRRLGLAMAGALGSALYRLPSKDRDRTIAHLRQVFGKEWTAEAIETTARAVYRELGRNLYDAVFLTRLPLERLKKYVQCENEEALRKGYEAGRGLVGISAHTGCFEVILPYFARSGMRCFAVGRELFDKRIDRMVSRARGGPNVVYVHRDNAGRDVVRRLREGMAFATLIDQDTSVEGVFARFLGSLAYTPSSPVKFAMKWDIPLYVATTARQPDNTHRIFIEGPLALEKSGDSRRDLVMNVQKVNDLICATIRKYPSQWVWMHRRWQRQPTDAGMEKVASVEEFEKG